ncbi:MAG TPA: hypothetical protein VMS32_06230 [Verrucomicrobiae bacterium]|nr:hypothetical protein [Verrucomicrobiae bacterium]
MYKFSFAIVALATVLATGSVLAANKLSPQPQGAEAAFVLHMQADLLQRFPTTAAAEKAGYFRYTNEDDTGSISYANLQWTSADARHPSQLWYDVHGNLLGADFSQPGGPNAPTLWGVNPARWQDFRAHVHYLSVDASGKTIYGHATTVKKFVAAGGDLNNPQATTITKMGLVSNGNSVARVFLFPHVWDLIVWVMPNPNGAFADKNPLVIPSASAETGNM